MQACAFTWLIVYNKKETAQNEQSLAAGDRNRTGTMSPPQDFKSCASASSATPASLNSKELIMDGGGFEPPKQFAADLQSVPFGHSGIHPLIRTICPDSLLLYHTEKKLQGFCKNFASLVHSCIEVLSLNFLAM